MLAFKVVGKGSRFLTNGFSPKVMTIEESKYLNHMKLEDLIGSFKTIS